MATGKQPPATGTDSERPLKKVKFSPQVSITEFLAIPAKEAVTFHLLYGTTAAELDAEVEAGSTPFSCEFFNQVFGEAEEINGYKGLQVHVWIALRSGHCWVDISFQESKPGADDVQALLAAWWQRPFSTSKAHFLQAASAAPSHDFSSMGSQLDAHIATGVGVPEGTLQLIHATLADTPDWFKELHQRLEPLLIFTIDGANFIDTADRKWEVVAAVMQRNGHSYLAGFMTLYNFYAWPMSRRPRVAQVLVMPPLQRCGYGRALIAAAYDLARQRDALDLTFEDPAPGLQQLREKLELEMMDAHDWVTAPAQAALAAAAAAERRLQDEARRLWTTGGKQQQANASTTPAAAAVQNGAQVSASAAAAADGAGSSSAGGRSAVEVSSPSSLLSMPQALQRRVTKELKIHKHQVHAVWEALLFLHSPLGALPPAAAPGDLAAAAAAGAAAVGAELLLEPLTEFVAARLERSVGQAADKAAANKRLVQVEGSEEDWFVYKLSKQQQQQQQLLQQQQQQQQQEDEAEEAEDEDLLTATVSVGRHTVTKVSADEHSERMQELVAARMEALAASKRRLLTQRAKQQ